MANAAAPSPKTPSTASAWSRLVQVTRFASSKSTHVKRVESYKPSEGHASPSPSTIAPVRRVRLRLPIQSSLRTDSVPQQPHPRTEDIERGSHFGPSASDADSIRACPCIVGEAPLPDGKCSLSIQDERKTKSKSPTSKQTKTATLSTFWSITRAEEKLALSGHLEDQVVDANSQLSKKERSEGSADDSWYTAKDETGIPTSQATDSASKDQPLAAKSPTSSELHLQPTNPKNPPRSQNIATQKSIGSAKKQPPQARQSERIASKGDESNNELTGLRKEDDAILLPTGPDNANTHAHAAATPSSSQASSSVPDSSPEKENDEPTNPLSPPPATPTIEFKRKAKRRLTLHSAKYEQVAVGGGGGGTSNDDSGDTQPSLPPKKKTKTQPKKKSTVQTTLSLAIGGSAGMRECKVCDTVYNPFHPEDVKVHAKRHAGVLKLRTKSNA